MGTRAEMAGAIQAFATRLTTESVGLFYYAGHGIQARGRNYLLPVDAGAATERALTFEAIDVGTVLEEMELAGNALNIVILDACRNNPFERRFRGRARGLAPVDAATGSIIAYATAPGALAADGDGDHGLYTEALLEALRVPGLEVEEVFKRVRVSVARRTAGEQVPWESSSLIGDFVFNAGTAGDDAEATLWARAETGGASALESYLARYPHGRFAPAARARLDALAATAPGAPSPLDGLWVGRRTCPRESREHRTVVARGRVQMHRGRQGEAGYVRQSGAVDAAGALALTFEAYNGKLAETVTMRGVLTAHGDRLSGTLGFTHPRSGADVACQVELTRASR